MLTCTAQNNGFTGGAHTHTHTHRKMQHTFQRIAHIHNSKY